MSLQRERTAEFMLLGSMLIEALYPIVVHRASHLLPPFFFIGMGAAIAACVLAIVILCWPATRASVPPLAIAYAFGVAFFIISGFVIVFFGTRLTSGINTALLGQTEVLYTLLLMTFVFGERMTRTQFLGACAVFLGTFLVLYNRSLHFNVGDVVILVGVAFYPIGNIFAKKALALIHPVMLLFLRYLFGSIVLLTLSVLFDDLPQLVAHLTGEQARLLGIYAIVILICSKIFWYMGIQTTSLSKAVSIIYTYPALSLLFANIFLREIPTVNQVVGCVVAIGGVSLLVRRQPVPVAA